MNINNYSSQNTLSNPLNLNQKSAVQSYIWFEIHCGGVQRQNEKNSGTILSIETFLVVSLKNVILAVTGGGYFYTFLFTKSLWLFLLSNIIWFIIRFLFGLFSVLFRFSSDIMWGGIFPVFITRTQIPQCILGHLSLCFIIHFLL